MNNSKKIEIEICSKCGHDLWHHANYSDGFTGTLFGECTEDKCNCKHP